MEIATNIKELRRLLGLTQEELALEIETSQSRISCYEKGETIPLWSMKKLINFARSHKIKFAPEESGQ